MKVTLIMGFVGLIFFAWFIFLLSLICRALLKYINSKDIRQEKPIFTIPLTTDDGGSGTYYGLGYQIELKGNFMPEDPILGIKYVKYSILGITVEEIDFE